MTAPEELFKDGDLMDAASALSDAFGLGDRFNVDKSWPVDEGDRVLRAEFTGEHEGELMLAVNADVCERLMTDKGRLHKGFQAAAEKLIADVEVSDEIELVERRPRDVVALSDQGNTCALFGVSVGEPYDEETEGPGAKARAEAAAEAKAEEIARQGGAVLDGGDTKILRRSDLPFRRRPDEESLLDVEVEIEVELGRTTMRMRDVLDLRPGHVIEFGRSADFPIQMMVNGLAVGWGEVVVVGEQFGVRVVPAPELIG